MNKDREIDIRATALELAMSGTSAAVTGFPPTPEEIVKRAEVFLTFLRGNDGGQTPLRRVS